MEHMTQLTRVESSLEQNAAPMTWPRKYPLFGVGVSCTTYDEVVRVVTSAAQCGRPGRVSALAVHGLMTGSAEAPFREALNDFEIITPDGQPVRVALNLLHGTKLTDRVYGPELMVRLCARAAAEDIGVYLYGSFASVVESLASQLVTRYPRLRIAGAEPSLFRPLTPAEDEALVRRINDSGAGILFVGLGCPRQE